LEVRARAFIVLICLPLFTNTLGCSSLPGASTFQDYTQGIHLHNAANEKLATEARDSFGKAKLGSTLREEGGRQTLLLQKELAATDEQTNATRDAYLIAFIAANDKPNSWDALDENIKSRIQDLGGSTDIARVSRQYAEMLNAQTSLNNTKFAYEHLRQSSDPDLVCPSLVVSSTVSEGARATFELYARFCKKYELAAQAYAALLDPDSALAILDRLLAEKQAEMTKEIGELAVAKVKLAKAKDEYDKALALGSAKCDQWSYPG